MARRAGPGPGPAVAAARRHVPRAVGGPAPARPPQPVRRVDAEVHPPTPPSRSAAAAARRTGAVRSARGAGAAHVSRQAAGLPLRARGRAQHRPRLPQGAAASAATGVPRGPVLLVASARARALADALRDAPAAARGRGRAPVPRPRRAGRRSGGPHRTATRHAHRRARRRRPGARLRPRERGGHRHLRARQGLHRRRRLDDGRLRQHEPPLVDPRLRAVVRRPRRRPATSASRAIRPGSATAPDVSRATPGCSSGASTSGAPRPTGDDDLARSRRAASPSSDAPRMRSTHGTREVASATRPPGHVRIHQPEHVPARHRVVGARGVARVVNDPDGRLVVAQRADHY